MMILRILAKLLFLLLLPMGFSLLIYVQGSVPPVSTTPVPLNCNEQCGGIQIPYPFGIGPGCFYEDWYEIECRSSVAFPVSAVPVLKKAGLEVLNITFNVRYQSLSMLTVRYPVISDAGCMGNGTASPLSLRDSPFIFATANLIAFGCNAHAMLITPEDEEYGCWTGDYDDVGRNRICRTNISSCQMIIETVSQEFKMKFTGRGEPKCIYAFFADPDWLKEKSLEAVSTQKFSRLVLYWGIPTNSSLASQMVPAHPSSVYRKDHSYFCDGSRTRNDLNGNIDCGCSPGYRGNPYLKNCTDIDECREHPDNKPPCPKGLKCVNKSGGHHCVDNWRIAKFVLIGIGSAVGVLLLLLLIWKLLKFIMKRKEIKLREKFFERNGGLLLQQQLNSPEGGLEKGRIFTVTDLAVATDNFNLSRVLGRGGQGTVYKGMLTDGRIVAIKKSIVVDEGMLEQFINEVAILSQINHRNIVKLLGCCLETEVPLLVYEFIPNGTLFDYIHDAEEEIPVTWETRLRIAIEIAGSLTYLHSAASIPIYHRDIKSKNILLDKKYRAKVADFGTSKSVSLEQTHVTTLVQGTLGYLDPEYFQTSQFTDKSDVYSFGVVLVELLTGQKPICSSREEEGRSLVSYFIISMEENHLFDILHPQVMEQATREEISRFANLAKRCLHLHGRNRPMMKEVVAELEEVRNIQFPSGILQNHKNKDTLKQRANGFGPNWMKADAGTLALPDEQEQPLAVVTTSW